MPRLPRLVLLARLARWAWATLAAALSLLVLVVNLRLYSTTSIGGSPGDVAEDVLPQLRFVRGELDQGAGRRMQGVFPEGHFFSHALYGLAWVELGLRQSGDSALRPQALAEARWALSRIDSAEGRQPFDASLKPPLGAFYAGWSAWLRGGILLLQPAGGRDAAEMAQFAASCEAIADALAGSPTPFLASYRGECWPCDSVVAVAALRLHDHLRSPRFGAVVDRWVSQAKLRLDGPTGLLPHRADASTGQLIEGARGSSQSVIQRFLPEIDTTFARQQYSVFRDTFVARPLAVPGIREYPRHAGGGGDVDSGPLIFGISASATVVTVGAAQVHGDMGLARPLMQAGEAFGVPMQWGRTKRYALGLLPVGDAFVAWSKTAVLWTQPTTGESYACVVGGAWRLPLHGLSLSVLVLLWVPLGVGRLRGLLR